MEQVFFDFRGGLPEMSDDFIALVPDAHGTETDSLTLVSTAGKIKNLRIVLSAAPGAGNSRIFTLYVNGAPSALTCTIANLATSCNDTTHEVDVVAGDRVCLKMTLGVGYADIADGYISTMFEGSTAKESLILGSYWGPLDKTQITYPQAMGAMTYSTTTENDQRQVCPTSGKIKNLYVRLSADPGTAPDAYRFTLRKNGASQTLTVTITANDTTGNDTTHEVTVAAGDILTLMVEPLSEPSETPNAHWGMTFVADTDGESIVLGGSYDNLNNAATEYICLLCTNIQSWTATEANHYSLGQSCTLKKLYILLSAAPGGGKSYTFTVRKPGNGQADGNLTVTITGAGSTTGHDAAHTDVISDDDYVDLKCVPAGTPDAADAYWGVVCYITPPAPPPVGLENKSANMGVKMIAGKLI